jgi:mannose-6-phosphate isomerase
MVIENVRMGALEKPWGSGHLGPWNAVNPNTSPIGELWFERTAECASEASLLLKLLFTSQPLSIQVHPTDAFAHALGLTHGKTEAWYILSAIGGSKVAVGLTRSLTAKQLRDAIIDGSIADLVQWRPVAKGDVIFVPAGTIHALGAGLIVAEVQQRSDTTFRLFDFGRGRALDVDNAVNGAYAGPADHQLISSPLDDVRILLVACEQFTLELIDLPPLSRWEFFSEKETWIFTLQGYASLGEIGAKAGEAVFLQMASAPLNVGAEGFKCLVAYADRRPNFNLLRNLKRENGDSAAREFSCNLALHESKNSWVRSAGVER